MTKLSRAAATKLCSNTLTGITGANDIVDVRKQKINFQLYCCRIVNDSCVMVIANNISECKQYLKDHIGGVTYTMADTNNWAAPYTRMQCWAGTAFVPSQVYVTIHKIEEDTPYMNGVTLMDYVKSLL